MPIFLHIANPMVSVPNKLPSALDALCLEYWGALPGRSVAMEGGGSRRAYFRLYKNVEEGGQEAPIIGVYCQIVAEARTFLGFTKHFAGLGIPVPDILAEDAKQGVYLLQDLGEQTLALQLAQWRKDVHGVSRSQDALEMVLQWLAKIQVRGRDIDYGLCSESPELDGLTFRADLTRFLRYLPEGTQNLHVPSENAAARELDTLIQELDALPRRYFCYRDFQTRNIMWFEGLKGTAGPVFLDYQSGRRGALAYDLASILYSPDTGLDETLRGSLTRHYLKALAEQGVVMEEDALLAQLRPMVLVRRLQAIGAYASLAREAQTPAKRESYRLRLAPAAKELIALRQSGWLILGLPALEAWIDRQLNEIAKS